jgi:transposase
VLRQVFSGRKIVAVGEQYGVPARTIHRWLGEWAKADAEGSAPGESQVVPQPSGATPIQEEHRALVLSIKHKHPNMGLAQIQSQLKRFHALKLSRHMIGRIFREAGIPLQVRSPASTQEDRSKNRFEMTRPNELWAIDFKEIWIHAEKIYALFVLDDYLHRVG